MYITITAQKLGANYSQSVADYVDYLEKENQLPDIESDQEYFFNQTEDIISPDVVIKEIDANTTKLKKIEPKFYSITVNPSQYELKKLQNNTEALKQYTRELMKNYASCFNREIDGRPVNVSDIKYCNASENSNQNGVEGYYSSNNLYDKVSKSFIEILVQKQLESDNENGNIKSVSFVILKNPKVPSVLLELGFLTNAMDSEKTK